MYEQNHRIKSPGQFANLKNSSTNPKWKPSKRKIKHEEVILKRAKSQTKRKSYN